MQLAYILSRVFSTHVLLHKLISSVWHNLLNFFLGCPETNGLAAHEGGNKLFDFRLLEFVLKLQQMQLAYIIIGYLEQSKNIA
jgi:hypothetical protein